MTFKVKYKRCVAFSGVLTLYTFVTYVLFCGNTVSGISPDDSAYYWLAFSDKEQTPYRTIAPEEFLSKRAIERRVRQGIAIDQTDLPVDPHYIYDVTSDDFIDHIYSSRWFNGILIRTTHTHDYILSLLHRSYINEVRLVKPPLIKTAVPASLEPDRDGHEPKYTVGQNFFDESLVCMKTARESSFTYLHGMYSPIAESDGSEPVSHLYGESGIHLMQLNAAYLHDQGFTGENMHIALLDAGFRDVDILDDFSSLRNEGRILGIRDFVDAGNDLFRSHQHGTFVLSTLASIRPGTLWGTAVQASYWLLRTEDAATEYIIEEYNWLAGIEFADSVGADIVNSSLGYSRFDEPSMSYSYDDLNGKTTVTARAAEIAGRKGLLVVNSAGNYGSSAWQFLGTPADASSVLTVGAIDDNRNRASFSSIGPTSDGRIKPEVMARGVRVPVTNLQNQVSYASGTSFSSPIIAGMAACLWQKSYQSKAEEIKSAILKSADRYHSPDFLYGYGIPNFEIAAQYLQVNQQDNPLLLSPNPVNANSSLSFYSDQEFKVAIELFDTRGQIIYKEEGINVSKGYNRVFPFSGLPDLKNGFYLLRVAGNYMDQTIKCLIMN